MKRVLVLCAVVLLINMQAIAFEYDENAKKVYYDAFTKSLFQGMRSALVSKGYDREKVNEYIGAMQSRLDRNELENATWSCVSKYSPSEQVIKSETVANECFNGWIYSFFNEKNKDTLSLLQNN